MKKFLLSLCLPIIVLSIINENSKIMIYGIIAVVVFVVILWLRETLKAAKDPDVIEASELGIPIWRYRKYQEAWDKIQDIYEKYGINTPTSSKMASEIISKLPNLNEWRRYGDKQCSKSFKTFHEFQKEYDEHLKK